MKCFGLWWLFMLLCNLICSSDLWKSQIFTTLFLLVILLNGLLACTRLLKLVYISPFSDTNPGTGLKSSSWVDWEALCQRCTALTRQGGGIFCAHFDVPVIGLPLWHRAWCAPCYRQIPGTRSLVYQVSNTDTFPIPNEDRMYLQAFPVDSIYFPF